MKNRTKAIIESFYVDNAYMKYLEKDISAINSAVVDAATNKSKILICGNGGSAADADHIVGELMKGFELMRPLDHEKQALYESMYGEEGKDIASKLQEAIPAISLLAHSALISAFENDVDPSLIYAQQVNGYGEKGDILIGISTSGNAENVNKAMMVANVKGLTTIGLTGKTGGNLAKLAKHSVVIDKEETYRVQEDHLKIYHLICRVVESELFNE